VQLVGNQMYNK